MQEAGSKGERFPVHYFDGVNASVQDTLAKRTELSHAENARAPQIGVLEKREGQTPKGTSPNGNRFIATANYGLVKFPTTNSSQQGVFRISASDEPTQTVSVSVHDHVYVNEAFLDNTGGANTVGPSGTTYQTFVSEDIMITEPAHAGDNDASTYVVSNEFGACHVYSLSVDDTWTKLSDSDAQDMMGGQFDYANANGDLVFVNKFGKNRLLAKDGATVTDSADTGSLYNSPNAAKACFYKKRIHLANFSRNGVKYPTTIVRSSYPLGVIALVNGDHDAGVTSINVTDTKYFYADSGMNTYDIYRGGTKIETVTVSAVNETNVTVSATTYALNSSDELWIAGTFEGAKQFRWVNNASAVGRDVKQYDTFRLSGGDEDEITLFETIGNVVMIGNRYSLATWDDYTLRGMDLNVGCSSPNGSAKLLGTLYFTHYSGIYATTGEAPNLISRKVERYIRGATKTGLENAACGVKGLSVFFAIGDSTIYKEDGSIEKTLKDVCLEYSVADQNWYVHTNMPIREFANFIAEDGTEHLLGSHEGNSKSVMDVLSGYLDDGEEIFFRADTQALQLLKEFETFAKPLAIISEVPRGSQMRYFVSLDRDDFYALEGATRKGVSPVKINARDGDIAKPVLARKIKVSFRDSSRQRCRLAQFAISYMPTLIDEPSE